MSDAAPLLSACADPARIKRCDSKPEKFGRTFPASYMHECYKESGLPQAISFYDENDVRIYTETYYDGALYQQGKDDKKGKPSQRPQLVSQQIFYDAENGSDITKRIGWKNNPVQTMLNCFVYEASALHGVQVVQCTPHKVVFENYKHGVKDGLQFDITVHGVRLGAFDAMKVDIKDINFAAFNAGKRHGVQKQGNASEYFIDDEKISKAEWFVKGPLAEFKKNGFSIGGARDLLYAALMPYQDWRSPLANYLDKAKEYGLNCF